MPSVYKLKPAFQNRLRPLTIALAGKGVTANQITVLAAIISVLQGVWIYNQPTNPIALLFLPLVLFIRMALNAIDGMLAREHGQKSHLGGVLNELGDVVSDSCLYLPFAMHPAISPLVVFVFVFMGILTEFTGVIIASLGGERRYDGPMGKSDRALFWGVISFMAAVGVPIAGWINWALVAAIVLLTMTIFHRASRGVAGIK